MKLYVSGPMTGIPEFNHPAFNAAAALLRSCGHEVINPAEVFDGDTTRSYADYMRAHIASLLTVDGLVVLPGWEDSRGARLETNIASVLGLPVRPLAEVLP